MSLISRTQLQEASIDASSLKDIVNGAVDFNGTGIVLTRLGTSVKTLAKLLSDVEGVIRASTGNAFEDIYATKALFNTALSGLVDGTYLVTADETHGDAQWIYVVSGNAVVAEKPFDAETFSEVKPEYYGAGAGGDDTAAFNSAIADGRPIIADGDVYNINPLNVTTQASIKFGENTVVNNTQAGGTKLPVVKFAGPGLSGTVDVTAVGSDYLEDTITVFSAAGFAVGDTVLIYEDEPVQPEVNNPTIDQDFNYREYKTIQSISGNNITFEEFLRFPYTVSNSLKLAKVSFLENCHVSGGIHKGNNPAGGAVELDYCRNSSATNIYCYGDLESDKNGGSALKATNNWECYFNNIYAKHTLFTMNTGKNQSSIFTNIQGKRTSNGGIILSGDRFCYFDGLVGDSPGDNNGDGLGLSNGFRQNIIGSYIITGARCYSLWMHESCDDNTFNSFKSLSGVTGCAYVYGKGNRFLNLEARNHPSFGLQIYGDDNYVNVDIEVEGTGVNLNNSVGSVVTGKSISQGTGFLSFDLMLGTCAKSRVELIGGNRGIGFNGSAQQNYSNLINLVGPKPYHAGVSFHNRGWTWAHSTGSVSATPKNLKIFDLTNANSDGLKDLVSTQAGDVGDCYEITLKSSTGLADSFSKYVLMNRQNTWYLQTDYEGASSFTPRLQISGANVQLVATSTSSQNLMLIKKF